MEHEKIYDFFAGEDLLNEELAAQFVFEKLTEREKGQLQQICEKRNIEFLIRPYDK